MTSRKRLTPGKIAVLLIAFFAFAAGIVVNRTVFERFPHLEDEFAYLFQARIFAGGQLWVPANESGNKVFWQPFVIVSSSSPDAVAKRFGKYTPGWPMLLALGAAAKAEWVVSPFLAMFGVLFTYRLGREMFSEVVGIIAALLLAISPTALLLNATYMSHAASLAGSALFVYAYWRLIKMGRHRYRWAAAAGLTLGWLIATRPLSATAIAIPVILHAASALLDTFGKKDMPKRFLTLLKPLLVLSVCVAPLLATWPVMNTIWTGDWRTNTYTLLWDYDKPGFGEGYGLMQGGHTLEFGWRNARTDLELYLRDLFGFTLRPEIEKYARDNLGWGAGIGLSWIPIAIGLWVGRKNEWVWLLFELYVALVLAQMTYWIGSILSNYSVRYWYEATFAMALIGALGLSAFAVWVNDLVKRNVASNVGSIAPRAKGIKISYLNGFQRGSKSAVPGKFYWQLPGYALVLIACAFSLIGYSPARFEEPVKGWPKGMYRYNKIGQQQVDAVQAARAQYGKPEQPVLIVVLNHPDSTVEDNWRDYGAALALTSPFLNSDMIVARVFKKEDVPEFVQRFPGRLVLYQIGERLYPSIDEAIRGATQSSS